MKFCIIWLIFLTLLSTTRLKWHNLRTSYKNKPQQHFKGNLCYVRFVPWSNQWEVHVPKERSIPGIIVLHVYKVQHFQSMLDITIYKKIHIFFFSHKLPEFLNPKKIRCVGKIKGTSSWRKGNWSIFYKPCRNYTDTHTPWSPLIITTTKLYLTFRTPSSKNIYIF